MPQDQDDIKGADAMKQAPTPGPLSEPVKGNANGLCNRSACQAPLADEPQHQFMDGNFTGGPRRHYCAKCSADFDAWDYRSGDAVRITREPKTLAPTAPVEDVSTKSPETNTSAERVKETAENEHVAAPVEASGSERVIEAVKAAQDDDKLRMIGAAFDRMVAEANRCGRWSIATNTLAALKSTAAKEGGEG